MKPKTREEVIRARIRYLRVQLITGKIHNKFLEREIEELEKRLK